MYPSSDCLILTVDTLSTHAVKSIRDRPAFYAEKLYKSMKGAGTDEHTLTRIMVSRSEADMVQIKQSFQEHYGKTLASFIKVRIRCTVW